MLLLPEVVDLLRGEGLRNGETIDADFLGGRGGRHFAAEVARLYDAAAMLATLRRHLSDGMSGGQISRSLAFFDSETGRRILRLEVSAREAIREPSGEEAAGAAFAAAQARGDLRAQAVEEFIAVNDLDDRNVAGALTSNYRFFRGLTEGGGNRMSDGEILDQVWSQADSLRDETSSWLRAYMFMAYQPLDTEEMAAYLAYSRSPEGQALNAALFAAFDEMYSAIYYGLGLAVAQAMGASDL
ncbi:hypothetical protein [Pseudooceanicola sp.]|uniref:hypothetical protein n=1 Tax=Pseudooceanicola sp. TaxID=1914328 RepID=UPI003516573B